MKIQSKTKIYRASALIKVDEMQCSNASALIKVDEMQCSNASLDPIWLPKSLCS